MSLLRQGMSVILDSPCRFQRIVDEGTAIAAERGTAYAFIECVLADEAELRRRLRQRERLLSQRPDFDTPPIDAPDDPMADRSGAIRIPETRFLASERLRIDTSRPPERCLAPALAYLERLHDATRRLAR